MSDYLIRCPYCGAEFTAYQWSWHAPECPYSDGGDA